MRPWNPNPLLRPSDRFVVLLRLVVALAVLLAVPVAGALGTQVYTADAAAIANERATKSAVDATITSRPQPQSSTAHRFEATVQWHTDRGVATTTTNVARQAVIGDNVRVWLDRDGAPTARPRDPGAAVFTGIGAAVVVLVSTWLTGWLLVHGVWWLQYLRHSAGWDREWRLIDSELRGDKQ